MKELVVISGKGGTGKTTLLASFAMLAGRSVLADCDVDAPDLCLLLPPEIHAQHEFRGGRLAVIDQARCTQCGRCRDVCRFGAVAPDFRVIPRDCEGCGACRVVCPSDAVDLPERVAGDWFRGQTKFGPIVYARLRPAEENSGKLVALVRKEARLAAEREGIELLLTDGPPGIGCPVIATLGNAALALIVTEPTPSGLHDLVRVLQLCRHFRVPAMVCVNKFDLNPDLDARVRSFCAESQIPVTKSIPFDQSVTRSIQQGVPLVGYDRGVASRATVAVWRQVQCQLGVRDDSVSPVSGDKRKDGKMPTLIVKHEGGMSSSINVRGHKLIADVPPEMGGQDRGPTPVDLLAGSLGTCIAFYLARWCKEARIPCQGFEVKVDYVHDRAQHCVPVLGVEISMPADFPEKRRQALLKVAEECTVHNTLCRLPQIDIKLAQQV